MSLFVPAEGDTAPRSCWSRSDDTMLDFGTSEGCLLKLTAARNNEHKSASDCPSTLMQIDLQRCCYLKHL
jgi:hypothetical protein